MAGADDEEKAIAGAAYSFVNDDMANLYSKDTTLQEKASGTWDYVRQAVLDPINIVGGVVGKAAGGASFRLGYAAARKAAIAEFRKQVAKGATEEAAKKAATRVYTRGATEAAEAAGKEVLKEEVPRGASKAFFQNLVCVKVLHLLLLIWRQVLLLITATKEV